MVWFFNFREIMSLLSHSLTMGPPVAGGSARWLPLDSQAIAPPGFYTKVATDIATGKRYGFLLKDVAFGPLGFVFLSQLCCERQFRQLTLRRGEAGSHGISTGSSRCQAKTASANRMTKTVI